MKFFHEIVKIIAFVEKQNFLEKLKNIPMLVTIATKVYNVASAMKGKHGRCDEM